MTSVATKQGVVASVARPSPPTISVTPSIGSALTIVPGARPGTSYVLYRDGIAVGPVVSGYLYVAADIGPSITVRAVRNGLQSKPSNALVWAGAQASLANITAIRDTNAQTISGAQVASWADDGGPYTLGTLAGFGTSPLQERYLGLSGAQFLAANSAAMQPSPTASGNLLSKLLGATGLAFHQFYVLEVGNVTRTNADIRDAEVIWSDSNTYFALGLQKIAGTIYLNAGYYSGGAWHQCTTPDPKLVVTAGSKVLVELKFDGTTLSLQVNNQGFATAAVGGAAPSLTGTLLMNRGYLNQYGNFSLFYMAAASSVQSATVTANMRAYLTNLYLTRVDYTPLLADVWNNGDTSTRFNFPVYSSEVMLVGDTDAANIELNITIYSQTIDASNDMEFSIGVATGPGPDAWTTMNAIVQGVHTDGTGWMVLTLAPIALPGTGTRRIWLISPAHGTGIFYEVQSLSLDAGKTWTPVTPPLTGPTLSLETMGGASLGNSNYFGWYYIAGVLQGGGFATARAACLGHLTQAIAGQAPGTILLFSPQTNDFRNWYLGTGLTQPSDAALQAQLLVSDVKATAPGWKVVYVTMCPLTYVGNWTEANQDGWRAYEASGATAGGADLVIDGKTVWTQADVSADHVHPYLSGSEKARTVIANAAIAVGRSGRLIWMLGNSLACGSAMYSPTYQAYAYPNLQGLPALLRLSGW